MNTLSEFLKSKRVNDSRGIQRALRELDYRELILCLRNYDKSDREIFYRNTTKRVRDNIEKGIEEISSYIEWINESIIVDAERLVVEQLIHFTNEKFDKPTVYPKTLPNVKIGSSEDIINTFMNISDQCRKYGLLSIDRIEEKTDNVLFTKGIELMLDGTDPLLLEEIMENYIKSLSNKYIRELNMISTAIKLIQMGSPSGLIVEKLKSLENI